MPEPVNPLSQQLAEQLRDVHLPAEVSWWPLAIGWWLVLAIVVLLAVVLSVLMFKKWRANRYRNSALSELTNAHARWQSDRNSGHYLATVNELLKKVMTSLGQTSNVSKSGSRWTKSLNTLVKTPLSEATQHALAFECYAAEPDVNIDELHADVVNWITEHRVAKSSASSDSGSTKIEGAHHA